MSVTAEHKPHARHDAHLHTKKNETRHDCYLQFPRFRLGTTRNMADYLGTLGMDRRNKKRLHF